MFNTQRVARSSLYKADDNTHLALTYLKRCFIFTTVGVNQRLICLVQITILFKNSKPISSYSYKRRDYHMVRSKQPP